MKHALVLLSIAVAITGASEPDSAEPSRWSGPPGSRPGTYEEWIQQHPRDSSPGGIKLVAHLGRTDDPCIVLYVDSLHVDSLEDCLATLWGDLEAQGYSVRQYSVRRSVHPAILRDSMRQHWLAHNVRGALLIGELPVAWFQTSQDWEDPGDSLSPYGEWPCDLFFMDLDGEWCDDSTRTGKLLVPGHDDIYDSHANGDSGDVGPEIFVSRIMPTWLEVSDTSAGYRSHIASYIEKAHWFRTSTNRLPDRAMHFVDDTWWTIEDWASDLAIAFPDTAKYMDRWVTRAEVYGGTLGTPRAWVSVFAHSWPYDHHFAVPGLSMPTVFAGQQYIDRRPPANFYNFYACSFCRFTDSAQGACGGTRAVFNDSFCVGALGSTKTGGMRHFEHFYGPLADGASMGDAFRTWFDSIAVGGFSHDEVIWYYGMVLFGDPFLVPVLQTDVAPVVLQEPSRFVLGAGYVTPSVAAKNHGRREMQQALAAYNSAVKANPKHAGAWHNMGIVYRDLGQPEKAVEMIEKAVQLNPILLR